MSSLLILAFIIAPISIISIIYFSYKFHKDYYVAVMMISIIVLILSLMFIGPIADTHEFDIYEGKIKPVVYIDNGNYFVVYEYNDVEYSKSYSLVEIDESTTWTIKIVSDHYGWTNATFDFKTPIDSTQIKVIDYKKIEPIEPIEPEVKEEKINTILQKSNLITK